jgi:hypothetical protein
MCVFVCVHVLKNMGRHVVSMGEKRSICNSEPKSVFKGITLETYYKIVLRDIWSEVVNRIEAAQNRRQCGRYESFCSIKAE